MPSDRTWAAGSEVVQDQGDGRTGGVRGSAAVAGAVATDVMDGAVQGDNVLGTAYSDLRRGNGEGEGLAQDAADAGDDVGHHGSPSSWCAWHQAA